MADLFQDSPEPKDKIVATYPYRDESGKLLFEVVRYDLKDFKQRRPDGHGGWIWDLKGVRRVLYNLPEVIKAQTVLICEGEKDCETAHKLGLVATCNPIGAGKWRTEYSESLRGRHAIIIPDNDEPGRRHARQVARSLFGVAAFVKIVELPTGKDLTDWAQPVGRGTRDGLLALIKETREMRRSDVAGWEAASSAPGERETQCAAGHTAIMRRASEIEPKAVRWVWPYRIALGKLTLFAGDPDEGKTVAALDIAARVTTGREWPDGGRARMGSVIIMTAEDDPDDTLVPRLMAARADRNRVHFLEASRHVTADGKETKRAVTLADIDTIEDAVSQVGDAKLVIVDPISAYLSGADSHKNAEVRALLSPLRELAARRGVAMLVITHLSKSGGKAIYRAIDSIGFVGAARAAWLFAKDKENPERRLVARLKNNLAADNGGLAYTLEGHTITLETGEQVSTVKVQWEQGAVNLRADDILATESATERSELAEAVDWLKATLAGGSRLAGDVLREARLVGISEMTLRRARSALGVKPRKRSFDEGWEWELARCKDAHEDDYF